MYRHLLSFTAVAATLVGTLGAVTPAEARSRGHSVSVQGSAGRGLTQSRSVSRQAGQSSTSSSVQTNAGYGFNHSGNASWGDGAYNASRGTTFNNGTSVGRTTTAVNNGDGTGSFSSTRNGVNGNSRTVSGTVSGLPQ